jgi:hypothetical protein
MPASSTALAATAATTEALATSTSRMSRPGVSLSSSASIPTLVTLPMSLGLAEAASRRSARSTRVSRREARAPRFPRLPTAAARYLSLAAKGPVASEHHRRMTIDRG